MDYYCRGVTHHQAVPTSLCQHSTQSSNPDSQEPSPKLTVKVFCYFIAVFVTVNDILEGNCYFGCR